MNQDILEVVVGNWSGMRGLGGGDTKNSLILARSTWVSGDVIY